MLSDHSPRPEPSAKQRLTVVFADAEIGLRRGVVEVTAAQDAWGRVFAQVAAVLLETAPPSVSAVEHIGSTSVPGLDAKPIIDIAIGVSPGTDLASLDDWLIDLGFLLRGDGNGIRPDRMFGYEIEPMIRLINVHLLPVDHPDWPRYLTFRDRLRAHPAERDAYGLLKRSLAAQHPDDRLAYIAGKESFIVTRRGV